MQSAAAVALMPLLIFFAVYTASVTRNAFYGPDNAENCHFSLAIGTQSNTVFLGPT